MSRSFSLRLPSTLWERLNSLSLLVAMIAVATLWGILGGSVTKITIVGFLINVILVVALQVFVGNSGVFSFGHVAFMAMGAYTVGMVRITPDVKAVLFPELPKVQLDPITAVLLGGLIAGMVAFLIGVPLMRLTGLVAGLATFGLLNIVFVVGSNLYQYTGGSTGMTGVPPTTTPLVAGIWTVAMLVVAWAFSQTRTCMRLRASREDEGAARSIGIGITRERTIAFVLSASIAGVSGGLFAQFFGTFNPEAFFLATTFTIIAMLVVGGALSLSGAVIGATAITVISETMRRLEKGVSIASLNVDLPPGVQRVGVAAAMLAILLLNPSGLSRGRELRWPRIRLPLDRFRSAREFPEK